MLQKVIFSKRDYLPRYSALPHSSDSSGDSSQLFIVQFVNAVVQVNQSVPLQAWSGPEGSRKLGFPDFMTTAQDSGKVASLTHRPPLPQGNAPGTHFC